MLKIKKTFAPDDDLDDKKMPESFFLFFGEVDIDISADAAEWILRNNFNAHKPKELTMFINSVGGDLNAAWAVIDLMRGSDIPITTVGIGCIASAGLLIFCAGQAGRRILTENTSIMSHQYYWGTEGKHHELIAQQKEMNLTQQRLVRYFQKVTKLTPKQINSYLMPPTDVYLSAQEALRLGICDIIRKTK